MGEGPRKWIEKRVGKAGTSGTVSHCLTLVSCPFFDARNDQREREREIGVSNSSDGELHKENVTASYTVNPWQDLLLLH